MRLQRFNSVSGTASRCADTPMSAAAVGRSRDMLDGASAGSQDERPIRDSCKQRQQCRLRSCFRFSGRERGRGRVEGEQGRMVKSRGRRLPPRGKRPMWISVGPRGRQPISSTSQSGASRLAFPTDPHPLIMLSDGSTRSWARRLVPSATREAHLNLTAVLLDIAQGRQERGQESQGRN